MIIDVSKWQGHIDWEKVAPQVEMAILRASCALSEDGFFRENCEGCRKEGVPYGAYHYLTAEDEAAARKQAQLFWNTAQAQTPLFYVADVEDSRTLNAKTDKIVFAFADELKKLGADKLGLYVGQYVYPILKRCLARFDFLWVPRYGINDGSVKKPDIPCDLHQYTSNGRVEGIGTRVDLNRLCGELELEWFTRKAGKQVRVAEGCWNVRCGNGAQYASLGYARQGDQFEYVARAENGWLCMVYKTGQLGWISGKGGEMLE